MPEKITFIAKGDYDTFQIEWEAGPDDSNGKARLFILKTGEPAGEFEVQLVDILLMQQAGINQHSN